MKLGIVIVTYNSEKHLPRLLDSIVIQKYRDLIVYIVDNNSNDNSLNIIQKYQSGLSLCIINTKTNNGFARGNNIGIQKAMDDGCEVIFILNPDMQLEERCIDILINKLLHDEDIGVIGPIVLFGDNPEKIVQVYGVNANFRTQKKVDRFCNRLLTNEIPPENFIDMVLGGAMMIRSSVLKITGLFEEDYFMYNDEIDIAYRVKKAGFKTICMRDAIVRHFHDFAAQNKRGNNLMYYYMMRNRYLYFKKYQLYFNLGLSLIIEVFSFPLKIIWSIRRMGNIKILEHYYSGLVDGLLNKKGIADKLFDDANKQRKSF